MRRWNSRQGGSLEEEGGEGAGSGVGEGVALVGAADGNRAGNSRQAWFAEARADHGNRDTEATLYRQKAGTRKVKPTETSPLLPVHYDGP